MSRCTLASACLIGWLLPAVATRAWLFGEQLAADTVTASCQALFLSLAACVVDTGMTAAACLAWRPVEAALVVACTAICLQVHAPALHIPMALPLVLSANVLDQLMRPITFHNRTLGTATALDCPRCILLVCVVQ